MAFFRATARVFARVVLGGVLMHDGTSKCVMEGGVVMRMTRCCVRKGSRRRRGGRRRRGRLGLRRRRRLAPRCHRVVEHDASYPVIHRLGKVSRVGQVQYTNVLAKCRRRTVLSTVRGGRLRDHGHRCPVRRGTWLPMSKARRGTRSVTQHTPTLRCSPLCTTPSLAIPEA